MTTTLPWDVEDLGRRSFGSVHEAMRAELASIAAGEQRGKVWLVEHEGVFTAGRATRDDPRPPGTVEVERGGRITWHGPGQLVVYPLVRLERRDLRAWLTGLEDFGVRVCGAFGLDATPSVDGTGVFVAGRKVASIGVAVRRWVNMHGIALNHDVAADPWERIRPCGLAPGVMTDLSTLLGRTVTRAEMVAAARDALPALLAAAGADR